MIQNGVLPFVNMWDFILDPRVNDNDLLIDTTKDIDVDLTFAYTISNPY